jgi:hypothetical protein
MAKGAITTIFSSTASATIANTTQERTLAGPGVGSLLLPANMLEVGTTLRILIRGVYSTSSAGDLTIRVKLGSVVLSTGVGTTSKSETNRAFSVEALVVCRTVGQAGSVMAAGSVQWQVTKVVTGLPEFIPAAAPVVVDTTVAAPVDVTLQWTVAAAGNTVTTTHFLCWSEQPV